MKPDNEVSEQEPDELAHDDADSPGISAKKARLRAARSAMKPAKTSVSLPNPLGAKLKTLAKNRLPKVL